MMHQVSQPKQRANSWIVDEFATKVPGVAHAIIVSADGLLLSASAWLPVDRADQLAAIASGLTSLTAGAARCLEAGDVSEVVVEMELGRLLLMSLDDGANLAVLASPDGDIGQIGYEMARLVEQVKHVMTPELRARLQGASGAGH